jgi:hypothetical protein
MTGLIQRVLVHKEPVPSVPCVASVGLLPGCAAGPIGRRHTDHNATNPLYSARTASDNDARREGERGFGRDRGAAS